ncbi:MAG: glycosyltransferase family 9 protein [Gemmatimonadetes bacterium]|nr:glycosyltransferase family 9 protein [Gemmatimonadota bacterium]
MTAIGARAGTPVAGDPNGLRAAGLELPAPARIAIVMLSALGDAVHVLPVANALKRHWPASRITWIIQPMPQRLAEGHAAVDEFLLFHRRRGARGLRSFLELRRQIAGRTFDLVVNLQVYLKAGVITGLLNSPVKLGFDRRRARDANWAFTTHRIPPHAVQHVQDQYFEFLAHLGIEPSPVAWDIPITAGERAAQAAWFAPLDRPACAVVVGTSRPQKNWAPERWARLLEHLYHDFHLQPVLVGGPSPMEREIANAVKADARAPVVDALGDDIRRLIWLLDGSALVVSPDTGPLHVARALDRPVVGLYGYTNPKRSGPYGRPEAVVDGYARYPGEPYQPSLEYRADGMARVTVPAALAVVERVLGRGPDAERGRVPELVRDTGS